MLNAVRELGIEHVGRRDSRAFGDLLGAHHWSTDPVRSVAGGARMNSMEILGAVTAAALLAYLTVALLKPEWFS
jgi:K+-transporting ATPase KdpF subunit